MKRKTLQVSLLALLASFALVGCQSHRTVVVRQPATPTFPAGEVVVVRETPPPVPREVPTAQTDPVTVWIPGYWASNNTRWVWVPGHWETIPQAGSVWIPGRWDKDATGRGWIWTPGRWS